MSLLEIITWFTIASFLGVFAIFLVHRFGSHDAFEWAIRVYFAFNLTFLILMAVMFAMGWNALPRVS